jgi:hypothetical protein
MTGLCSLDQLTFAFPTMQLLIASPEKMAAHLVKI